MKKSKAETAETRKRIVKVAAQAFRSTGIHATGVAEIMAAAGLSHGGFYRHFESKEQLVAEACTASMDLLIEAAKTAFSAGDDAFLKHLENLLSVRYREDFLGGCPLVATGSEIARADIETRRAVSDGFRELVDIITKRNKREGVTSPHESALFTMFSMIGAVTMARVVDDADLADQILSVARARLANRSDTSEKKPLKSKTK
jgi:TetR/AcrR family transcriptional repressor of nem operon